MAEDEEVGKGVEIVYDGACPFCANFVALTRLREAAGPVRLVDARSDDPLVGTLLRQGVDLDRGMVVRRGTRTFHGPDAMREIARLSRRKGTVARLTRLLFGRETTARRVYPVLAEGRRAALALLGRSTIAQSRGHPRLPEARRHPLNDRIDRG